MLERLTGGPVRRPPGIAQIVRRTGDLGNARVVLAVQDMTVLTPQSEGLP
ncbi:hypothetical protein KIH74_32255 [Kineosporia sp. J2-2]|uniref:Uncharacterized protein n=1 Tax=Kineosporia corallincola TaxID=2835133 RepID=A0ABS5TS75_9ACTN|nr:hypothetical protein [Kineosporia corallincola]MBT0773662.1 hypothetical protein [Kineosporia corallincola]